jgi:hypothetical protein
MAPPFRAAQHRPVLSIGKLGQGQGRRVEAQEEQPSGGAGPVLEESPACDLVDGH